MLCHMTSRRDNSPHRSPSKLRILALEAELATERSARATLAREHADLQAKNVALQEKVAELQAGHAELLVKHGALQAKHDLLVAEHDRLNAFLKLYASEHHSEKRIFSPDARQLKLLFEQSPELAAAREAALAEAAKLVEQHKARSATRPQRGKRQSDKGLPAGLRRVIEMVEASPEQLVCELHGERKLMGYDWRLRRVQRALSAAIGSIRTWGRRWSWASGGVTCRSIGCKATASSRSMTRRVACWSRP